MSTTRRQFAIVAALLGATPVACSESEGAKSVDASAPSTITEASAPTDRGEASSPSNGATCGGGAKAVVRLDALANAVQSGTDAGVAIPVAGNATFAASPSGVDLSVSITGCVSRSEYPIIIHEGAACTSAMLQGPDWDAPRGDGISRLTCTGTSGVGLLYYARPSSDPKPWSVGGPSLSDVTGHVLVIHDPVTMQPLACGAIVQAPDDAGLASDAPSTGAVAVPSAIIRAQLAGLCVYRTFSPPGQCPDPEKLSDCACTHCNLSACLSQCPGYVACLQANPDAGCATTCVMDSTCAFCGNDMLQCLLSFCPDVVECAVPTPGGPCSQVEACCAKQGPRAQQCLTAIQEIAKLGGDPSCIGAMHDWDFLTNEAYDPPCDFDDAGQDGGTTDAAGQDGGPMDAADAFPHD